jgi:integrase
MASIQKRTWRNGTVTYVVRWRTADGREHSKGGFATRKAVRAFATEVEHRLQRGTMFDPKAGGVTFREVAQAWIDSRHDLKPGTHAMYRKALAPASTRRGAMRELGIDATFGGYPINVITREHVSQWVQRLTGAGRAPITVRHAYVIVRQVLRQAVHDDKLPTNPADNVKLPSDRTLAPVVDDPAQFLSPPAIAALVEATPWPYSVLVHVAAWAGLRAAELAGLQVGDVNVPLGELRVERQVQVIDGADRYLTPKTKSSGRTVPLTPQTANMLRDYLAEHPHSGNPTTPLWPAVRLARTQRNGTQHNGTRRTGTAATRQLDALAALTVPEHAARLVLDWAKPLRHVTFYRAVFKPAVLRAGLSPDLRFHSLRHTYASLCIEAGIQPLEISRFMGHSKVATTLNIYAHLLKSDHSDSMSKLGGLSTGPIRTATGAANVVPLRRR